MAWVTIDTDGTVRPHEGTPTMEDLNAAVGGYFEVHTLVRDGETAVLWVAEEPRGTMKPNPLVQALAATFGHPAPYVGHAAVTGPGDDDGETLPLTDNWLAYLNDQ